MAKKSNAPAKRKQSSGAGGPAKKAAKRTDSSSPKSPNVRIVESITPEKSPQDQNDYRIIKLSTGLTVALISRNEPSLDDDVSHPPRHRVNQSILTIPQLHRWSSSLNHSEPECHFIQSTQAPTCHFTSTPTCYFESTPADLGCQYDNNYSDPSTFADHPSTVVTRYCSEPHDFTSVAAVVNVGGMNDPENLQGLAHFTEHMVHYGSGKFPKEDSVKSILYNFGTYNATTGQNFTSYFNEVPDILLERSLELFSDMLTQPIFKMDVLKREVNAVDNEFYLRLPQFKRFMLQTHVSIQNKSHPLTRFLCGTLETLGGGTARGTQIVQNEMRKTHQQKYVASAMTLSINSTKSLEDMQGLVIRHFSNLLQGDHVILSKAPEDKPQQKLTFQRSKHVYSQDLSRRQELTFLWYLPASLWTNAPQERVMPMLLRMLSESSLVGLKHYLYNRDLIWYMYAVGGSTKYATNVEITFWLTPRGSQNTKVIEDATMEYITFLQDKANERFMKRLFEEMRIMHMKEFEYGSQITSLQTTMDFATRLQYAENPTKLLIGESWRDSKFNYASIQNALALLTREDLTVIQSVPKDVSLAALVPNGKVQIAPYSNVKYVEMPRSSVSSPQRKTGLGLDSSASLVRIKFGFVENKLLQTDIENLNRRMTGSGDAGGGCLCPENYGDIKLQHLKWKSQSDLSYDDYIPKIRGIHYGHSSRGQGRHCCQFQIRFCCPSLQRPSSRTIVLSSLWRMALKLRISPCDTQFFTAGFSYDVRSCDAGIAILIEGFPRDLQSVMQIMVKAMLDEEQQNDERILTTANVFPVAKQLLKIEFEPQQSEGELISNSLIKCSMYEDAAESCVDLLGILESITLENLQNFITSFKQSAFSIVELQGNIPLKFFQCASSLLETMPFAPLLNNNPALYSTQFLPYHPNLYNPGETCVRVMNMGSTSYTTNVTNMYVLGTFGNNQKEADMFGTAMHFINCQAFMNLRTKQQLGYSVHVMKLGQSRATVRAPLMMFAISVTATAKKFTACHVDQKIDEFLEDYVEYLENMPDDLFETRLKLTCSPETFTKEDVSNWFEKKFPRNFGNMDIKWKCLRAGIKKQSVQVLCGNPDAHLKQCKCAICSSISGWRENKNFGPELRFATGGGITKSYFVTSPKF